MAPSSPPVQERSRTAFLRDTRVLNLLAQAALVAALVLAGLYFANNVVSNLRASNIPMGWGFFTQSAGFEISDGPPFDPTQSYGRAFVVGIVNTVRVVVAGIILATLVGLLVGIARLSTNWLLRTLAGVYVETIRNTPLLLQLFFWYFAVIMQLPPLQERVGFGDSLILSNRGVVLIWPYQTATGAMLPWWLLGAAVAGLAAWYLRRRALERSGRIGGALPAGLLAFAAVAVAGYLVMAAVAELPAGTTYELRRGDRGTLFADNDGDGAFGEQSDSPLRYVPVTLLDANGAALGTAVTGADGTFRLFDLPDGAEGTALAWETPPPLLLSRPQLQGFNIRGGRTLSPEFAALLLGLVLYTGAFIAEIVRAGINAVPKGQWEASRAVGLSNGAALRLIVLPQALRVIIPPLTSQYLNLTKNSSLAIAIAYPDLFNVALTIMNQSGSTVQMFLVIMATYLGFSLLTSLLMNWYNRRMALVER